MMVFVAVDVDKRRCVTCVMGQDGSVLDSGSYPNTMFDASHYGRQTVEKYGECKAVVESSEAKGIGIAKSTLHYLRKRAKINRSLQTYGRLRSRLESDFS